MTLRFVCVLTLLLFCTVTAWGDGRGKGEIHFIALAQIAPGGAASYNRFLKRVDPIWKRHGMTVVSRFSGSGALGAQDGTCPYDVAVLHVRSRAGFNAYLRDPDYRAIRAMRLNALDMLLIFDGVSNASFPSTEPAALSFYRQTTVDPSASGFRMSVQTVGPVKGKPPAWASLVKSIEAGSGTAPTGGGSALARLIPCRSE